MLVLAPPIQHYSERAMGGRWNYCSFKYMFFVILLLGFGFPGSSSLTLEGSILLKFRELIDSDPFNSLASWSAQHNDPCSWSGVHCEDDKVQMLNLSGISLRGRLAPELGNLSHLRTLVLHSNHFSGSIPPEFGCLTKLEVLDLRENNLTGLIPAEIAKMKSLKILLLGGNNLEGTVPLEIEDLSSLSELQFDENIASVTSRKFGHRLRVATESWNDQGDDHIGNTESTYEPNMLQISHSLASTKRRILSEQSSNLEAVPNNRPVIQVTSQPISRSSGSYPAIANGKSKSQPIPLVPSDSDSQQEKKPAAVAQSPRHKGKSSVWVYVAIGLGIMFLIAVAVAVYFMWRSRARPIGPFKTGISGQLQKAFVTGVPKLNRPELETACEDFSNIICNFDAFTIYKGTLSSGVEIAVASTIVTSLADWSEAAELAYRKKIETLSRVNHKNFVNLLGYCEEDEPFTRMMVFEYAPSGNLYEHIHVREVEHLDWNSRMRVIMGTAYCLQYMHHDLNPPVTHPNLRSSAIFLTDDNAAKIAIPPFDVVPKDSGEGKTRITHATNHVDPAEDVYKFGILLLEIITGRLANSEELGSLVDWAKPYLNDKENMKDLIDPILKSVRTNELEAIREVIQDSIKPNPLQRPTMREVTSKLKDVIPIAPDAAVPRLSPLWWAELEILSVEAT